MPRILFLVSGRSGPSVRFRVDQFLPHFARRGISAEVADLYGAPAEQRRLLRRSGSFDHIVVHRALLDVVGLLTLRLFGGPFVYDFDDALWLDDSASRATVRSPSRERRVARMVRAASHATAGNRYLADWAAERASAVTVVPTTIDLTSLPPDETTHREPIVGWIGTRVNLPYLRPILPALADLARLRAETKLKVVCDEFPQADGIEVLKKPWSLGEEAADVASFAVGIMPLPDDPWTRGKCALKILQYFAASRPVVCSPVGANLEVVEHGRSGFFAETRDEWVARLDELLADPEKRRRMGAAGRKTVETRYTTAGHVDRLLAAIGVERTPA